MCVRLSTAQTRLVKTPGFISSRLVIACSRNFHFMKIQNKSQQVLPATEQHSAGCCWLSAKPFFNLDGCLKMLLKWILKVFFWVKSHLNIKRPAAQAVKLCCTKTLFQTDLRYYTANTLWEKFVEFHQIICSSIGKQSTSILHFYVFQVLPNTDSAEKGHCKQMQLLQTKSHASRKSLEVSVVVMDLVYYFIWLS